MITVVSSGGTATPGGGGMLALWIWRKRVGKSLAGNGFRPVSMKYNTPPSEKMSDQPSISAPRACSGDM